MRGNKSSPFSRLSPVEIGDVARGDYKVHQVEQGEIYLMVFMKRPFKTQRTPNDRLADRFRVTFVSGERKLASVPRYGSMQNEVLSLYLPFNPALVELLGEKPDLLLEAIHIGPPIPSASVRLSCKEAVKPC